MIPDGEFPAGMELVQLSCVERTLMIPPPHSRLSPSFLPLCPGRRGGDIPLLTNQC